MRTFLLLTTLACLLETTLSAQPSTTSQHDPLAQRMIELFQTGYGRGATTQKEARRLYDMATSESRGDARIEYAYGLVLLKQLKNKEALTQFQSATRSSGTEYLPAWQALVWMHFTGKDYGAGYERLRDYAKRLVDPNRKIDSLDQENGAEWIGKVLAALQKTVDTIKQKESLRREDEALTDLLGPQLRPAILRGKSSVHSLHSLLEEDVQQTRVAEQAKEEKERAEKELQVKKDLEASAEKRESLKKSAEESKKYLDEQLATFDKQLTRLERDYDFLQKRIVSIAASQVQLNLEMSLISNRPTNGAQNNTGLGAQQLAVAYEQRKAALELQGIRYQIEMDQTVANTLAVSQKAQALIGQRSALVRQYERTTGTLVQQDSALDKWQERLKKDGERLKSQPKTKTAPLTNKIQQARSFRTYVDLDLNLERDQLLDTFGVAIVDNPDSNK